MALRYSTSLFPNLAPFERFNAIPTKMKILLVFYLKQHALSCCRGTNYIDSTISHLKTTQINYSCVLLSHHSRYCSKFIFRISGF